MNFKVRPNRVQSAGQDIKGSMRAIRAASSEIASVAKVLKSGMTEYDAVAKTLYDIRDKAELSGDTVNNFSLALGKIAALYIEAERGAVAGRSGKAIAHADPGTGKGGKGGKKDFWQRLKEKLGIESDKFKGVPEWMEVLGWLNRQAPWTWIFYTATKEGWLDDVFDFLDFEKDKDGIYHVDTNKYHPEELEKVFRSRVVTDDNGICWQQFGGYTDFYDQVFDFFCDMEADKSLTFVTASGVEYTLWRWKGEYLNLGAGGEIGIYKGNGDIKKCAVDDELKIKMHVDYGDGTSSDWEDETWWCTSFNPQKQNVRAEDITITYTIDFSSEKLDPEIWRAFQDSCSNRTDVIIDAENKIAYITY